MLTARRSKGPDAEAHGGRLSVAALLVAIAHSDHDYAEIERQRIADALSDLFSIERTDAEALRDEAEAAHDAAADLHRFTLAVKRAYDLEERAAVLEAAWRVVFADDVRDAHENALMRRLAALLGVEDRVSGLARRRAEARDA